MKVSLSSGAILLTRRNSDRRLPSLLLYFHSLTTSPQSPSSPYRPSSETINSRPPASAAPTTLAEIRRPATPLGPAPAERWFVHYCAANTSTSCAHRVISGGRSPPGMTRRAPFEVAHSERTASSAPPARFVASVSRVAAAVNSPWDDTKTRPLAPKGVTVRRNPPRLPPLLGWTIATVPYQGLTPGGY